MCTVCVLTEVCPLGCGPVVFVKSIAANRVFAWCVGCGLAWSAPLAHYVVRALMAEVAQKEGIDPRRLSFTGTLKILRCRMAECPKDAPGQRKWYEDLMREIATEKLPPRRDKINPRVIKRKMSKWAIKRATHRNNPQPEKTFRESIDMLD